MVRLVAERPALVFLELFPRFPGALPTRPLSGAVSPLINTPNILAELSGYRTKGYPLSPLIPYIPSSNGRQRNNAWSSWS